jgi:hypothetical protein
MPDDVGTLEPEPVENGDGIGHVGLDVERSRCGRGGQSALLIAVDGERIVELTNERLGVLRETGATVKHHDRRS